MLLSRSNQGEKKKKEAKYGRRGEMSKRVGKGERGARKVELPEAFFGSAADAQNKRSSKCLFFPPLFCRAKKKRYSVLECAVIVLKVFFLSFWEKRNSLGSLWHHPHAQRRSLLLLLFVLLFSPRPEDIITLLKLTYMWEFEKWAGLYTRKF